MLRQLSSPTLLVASYKNDAAGNSAFNGNCCDGGDVEISYVLPAGA